MLLKRLSNFVLVGAVMALVQGCGGSTSPPPNVQSTSVPYLDPTANAGKAPTKAPTKAPEKAK